MFMVQILRVDVILSGLARRFVRVSDRQPFDVRMLARIEPTLAYVCNKTCRHPFGKKNSMVTIIFLGAVLAACRTGFKNLVFSGIFASLGGLGVPLALGRSLHGALPVVGMAGLA
jgi:hypothetical protein